MSLIVITTRNGLDVLTFHDAGIADLYCTKMEKLGITCIKEVY